MMTGKDTITAEHKNIRQFEFTNTALFMFSANTVPTISEDSRAYANRIHPVKFGVSFEGHEDPEREAELMDELPGILVRLVRAWQRQHEHGYRSADEQTRQEFENASNRVLRWFRERCDLIEIPNAQRGAKEPKIEKGTTKTDLAKRFNEWAEDRKEKPMGLQHVVERLLSIKDVREVRFGQSDQRGLNIELSPFE
jgi:putative DNA primase/helicase